VPADRQVTVSALPADDAPATPILFLLGRGQITRDFTASLAGAIAGAPADTVGLTLVPKTAVPEYDRLTIVVDRATLALRMLIARDAQGGTSTFVFKNLQENVGLPDSRFAFTIPKGADVVRQ
jgi:outer membrane lipoprotein carrier protein